MIDAAMTRFSDGDADAFDVVYDDLEPRLRSFLGRLVRDDALRDDLLQQTFMCMIQSRETFVPGAPVLPWARSIARNLLYKLPKCSRMEVPIDLDGSEGDLGPACDGLTAEQTAMASQMGCKLAVAFAKLPVRQRKAIDLVCGEGLSHQSAAHFLRTTTRAVTVLVCRARKALRAVIAEPSHGRHDSSGFVP